MNPERLIKMVTLDMTSDLLKLEEELERWINDSTSETEEKVKQIKRIIKAIAEAEAGLAKFSSMMDKNNITK